MSELILFIVAVLQRNEDAQIMRACHNAHTCPSELCAELVVAPGTNAFFWAVNIECGNGRVMGGLLGEVGYSHGLVVACDAVGTARRRRSWGLQGRVGVFNFPVALRRSVGAERSQHFAAYSEELAQSRIIRLARLALDIFLAWG